jgi:hypothetical protein
MTHELYSETDNWQVETPDQDVRGWNVVDERGQQIGTVADMYVDTQTETIDRLILDDGSEVDVSTVLVDEGTIRVGGMGGMTPGADRQDMSGAATADRADTDDTWRIRRHGFNIENQGDVDVRENRDR